MTKKQDSTDAEQWRAAEAKINAVIAAARATKDRDMSAADADEIGGEAIVRWAAERKNTPGEYARRALGDWRKKRQRRRPHDQMIQADGTKGWLHGASTDASGVDIERRITDPELLKEATIEECRRWFRDFSGGEWDDDGVAHELKRDIALADAEYQLEEKARLALLQLRAAIRAVREAADLVNAGPIALVADDGPRRNEPEDTQPEGGPLAHYLTRHAAPVLDDPALDLLLETSSCELEVLRIDLSGLSAERDQGMRRLAYTWIRWNGYRDSAASEIAKVAILLGHYPEGHKPGERGATPAEVIKTKAGGLKKQILDDAKAAADKLASALAGRTGDKKK